ncbi:hypothetical protein TW86_03850 [Halomonas sp. S2151]|nr:hypothetical protein TW86_03850 [Halomonas sp. S2151]
MKRSVVNLLVGLTFIAVGVLCFLAVAAVAVWGQFLFLTNTYGLEVISWAWLILGIPGIMLAAFVCLWCGKVCVALGALVLNR